MTKTKLTLYFRTLCIHLHLSPTIPITHYYYLVLINLLTVPAAPAASTVLSIIAVLSPITSIALSELNFGDCQTLELRP